MNGGELILTAVSPKLMSLPFRVEAFRMGIIIELMFTW